MSSATAALGTSGLKRSREPTTLFPAGDLRSQQQPAGASAVSDRAPTVSVVLPASPTSSSPSPDASPSSSPSSQLQDSMQTSSQQSPEASPSAPAVHSQWRPSAPEQLLYGTYEDIGGRGYMEDRHVCAQINSASHNEPVTVAAVFDGHGSSAVAEFLESNMAGFIQQELSYKQSNDAVALHKAFMAADAALKQAQAARVLPSLPASPRLQDDIGGSTAVVVLCSQEAIICANCGDSRAVLARGGCQAIALSDDHRPDRTDEMARINEAGGCVMHFCGCPRVMGVLAMSRALGDLWLQRFGVIASPEVKAVQRDAEDEFVIVASDGLWVAVSNEEAVHLARRCLRRAAARGAGRAACLRIAAKVLAQLAAQRGNKDNITVLIVDLEQPTTKSGQWPCQDASGHYLEGAAAEASLLQLCSGKSDAATTLTSSRASSSSSDGLPVCPPATPRIEDPPATAASLPRSKSAAQQLPAPAKPNGGPRRASLDDGVVLCQVHVRASPWGDNKGTGMQRNEQR